MKLSNALYLLPIAFLAAFYFYPLAAILQTSFAAGSGWTEIFTDLYYARVLVFTFVQAALSTLLTLALGLPAAYIFARYDFPGASIMRAITTIPFLMPTIIVATAFSALFGPRGIINLALIDLFHLDAPPIQILNTLWIILLAHTFYNFTVVLRIVGGFWSNLDPQIENAARVLGADRMRTFLHVTLPLIAPALIAAALLVFIFDFTSFGVVLILGGARLATLEVEIYRQTVNLFDLPVAAALSLVQLVCTFALMAIYTRLQAHLAQPLKLRPQAIIKRKPASIAEKIFVWGYLAAMLTFLLTPLISVVVSSLASGTDYYSELFINRRGSITFVPPIDAVKNSLIFASLTVILAVALGLIAAHSLMTDDRRPLTADRTKARRSAVSGLRSIFASILDPLFMLPLGTSAVTLGFGYILTLGNLRTSIWLLPIAHALVAFPFVLRSLLPILRSIQPRLREAAQLLGASPGHVWREIDFPIMMRAVIVGAVFAFTVSMGEFAATTLIARPEMPTIPIAIYRLLGQPGMINLGQALALSTILMVISALAIIAMERFRIGEIGEF
ncbi:MAG: iron ABC transporter permease [Chloroflexi bacterium]|nr:iron ABC transporter permease [Chloroflexota bacterium]